MKKILIASVVTLAITGTAFAQSGTNYTELSVDKKGNVSMKSAVVTKIAGTNIYVNTKWGSSLIRWIITTSTTTQFNRRFGGASGVGELAENDVLNIDGVLDSTTSGSLIVRAQKITNWSKENEAGSFSGTIANLDLNKSSLTIITKGIPNIQVIVPSNLTIKKGARWISLSEVKNGDVVVSTTGSFNAVTRTLIADSMEIYQEKNIFLPQNFQGTLKSLDGTSVPTTMVLAINGKEYTVKIGANATVMNAARATVSLQRFVVGDTIRIYGAIDQTNLSVISTDIVRNISL